MKLSIKSHQSTQHHKRYLTDFRGVNEVADEEGEDDDDERCLLQPYLEDEEMLCSPESIEVECHAALDRMQSLVSKGHSS